MTSASMLLSSALYAQNIQLSDASNRKPVPTTNMTTNTLPLFYQSIELVDSQKHQNWGVSNTQNDFGFARQTNLIPLVVTEVNFAMRNYPVLFVQEPNSTAPTLVALVGNGQGQNQFIESNGQWRASTYVPAWVRLYPFLMVGDPSNSNAALAFDAKSKLFTEKGSNKLIDSESKPLPALERILAFHRDYNASLEATVQMAKALADAGVLEPAGVSFKVNDTDQPRNLQGFMIVNESKLRALDATALHKLSQANALGLAFAQILSMPSFQNITPPKN